jgi:hypothetical protein
MSLNFPNESRTYDAKNNLVCFWGYDNVLEVSFLVELNALCKLSPQTRKDESGYLGTFDALLERIHKAARKVYSRSGKSTYILTAGDF